MNDLPSDRKFSSVSIFLNQFKGIFIFILLSAALMSAAVSDFFDSLVIFFAIILNVVIGFFQEVKAERALFKLKTYMTLTTQVYRGGRELIVPSEDLVCGDIVVLNAGDHVPADGRIISAIDCEINEASLTGESAPVVKQKSILPKDTPLPERSNMVHMGTSIMEGKAKVVITTIGSETEFGNIASSLSKTKEDETPLLSKFKKMSQMIGLWIIGIAGIVLLIGLFYRHDIGEMMTLAIALAVAAIPEGLVIALTVVLAVGAHRMVKHKALIRKLSATETLGSTTIICADKTGTLTEGNMEVTDILTWNHHIRFQGHRPKTLTQAENEEMHFAVKLGVLCNDAVILNPNDQFEQWKFRGNLTERALLRLGRSLGYDRFSLEQETPRVAEIPFDSDKKFMATLHRFSDHENIVYVKGAPEFILQKSSLLKTGSEHMRLTPDIRRRCERKILKLSQSGLRILGLAYVKTTEGKEIFSNIQQDETSLIFLGLMGIKDPLRPTAKQTILECQDAGIIPVMITGDQAVTAKAIAKELGMKSGDQNILDGRALDAMDDRELKKRIHQISVYARVSPHHKTRIIDAWQSKGEVVAMTGDGVNDSPALKSADIGVALGSGSDVAKEVSDVVILDDNFSTIVAAVEQGRVVFDNIKKVTLYLLSDSFSEIILITSALVIGLPLPLTAIQILWINLVTDGFTGLALTNDPPESDVMKQKPRGRGAELIDSPMKMLMAMISVIAGLGNLLLFWFILKQTQSLELAQTIVFASSGIDSLIYVFSIRNLRKTIFESSPLSNPLLILGCVAGFLIMVLGIYAPFFQKIFHTVSLGAREWALIMSVSAAMVIGIELFKFFVLHKRKK